MDAKIQYYQELKLCKEEVIDTGRKKYKLNTNY
jgi:hypothetical protein